MTTKYNIKDTICSNIASKTYSSNLMQKSTERHQHIIAIKRNMIIVSKNHTKILMQRPFERKEYIAAIK